MIDHTRQTPFPASLSLDPSTLLVLDSIELTVTGQAFNATCKPQTHMTAFDACLPVTPCMIQPHINCSCSDLPWTKSDWAELVTKPAVI